jgi:Pyridoxamine 5'-phosphate oxidase
MTTLGLDGDQRNFLATTSRAFLFANRRDGSPTGWPMTALWNDDDVVYFNTYRASAKAQILFRDPRVGVIVMDAARALRVRGDAELVDGEVAAPLFARMVRTDGFVPEEQAARAVRRLQEGKRCLFRIVSHETRWCHGPAT